ncbi:MAG: site-2 protease family protein [Candidatus Tectomicrobia bacterium]|uniref:Site-2 protease family protein n=1 Tax=Tectimicrobiota bacterium TaxID=2528274 RepID=A0A932M1Z9_UNCTE|nr:site-2 protease family protein [Candidatus Tectomicrobia bacterium]
MDIRSLVLTISIVAVPIIVAIVLHEVAHGWVAWRLGDPTAKMLGRLTLNPLAHVDIFGTILLPLILLLSRSGILFGYAKPVPVNFLNLRRPKQDMVWVAAAGPAMNLVLALLGGIAFRVLMGMGSDLPVRGTQTGVPLSAYFLQPVLLMLIKGVQINVLLAVFNLIPIPPADGGRILVGLLPPGPARLVSQVEPVGMVLLMVFLLFDPLNLFSHTVLSVIHSLTLFFLGTWRL